MTDFTILAAPRIQQATFARILRDAKSPAAVDAPKLWVAIIRHGVDPALALAVFQHESSYGKAGAAVSRRNWGNLRTSPNFPRDGGFVTYPSWVDGAGDAARLLARYGRNEIRPKKNTRTALTFPFVWAPSADGNKPDRYGKAVVAAIQRFIEIDRALNPAQPKTVVPAPAVPAAPAAPATVVEAAPTTTRVVVLKDHSRIRTKPDLKGAIVRSVDRGFAATAGRTVVGAIYEVAGVRSNRWIEIVGLDGKRLAAPVFSAAILWRKA
jgi:hypothetical protein